MTNEELEKYMAEANFTQDQRIAAVKAALAIAGSSAPIGTTELHALRDFCQVIINRAASDKLKYETAGAPAQAPFTTFMHVRISGGGYATICLMARAKVPGSPQEWRMGVAWCSPEDRFERFIGRNVALARLRTETGWKIFGASVNEARDSAFSALVSHMQFKDVAVPGWARGQNAARVGIKQKKPVPAESLSDSARYAAWNAGGCVVCYDGTSRMECGYEMLAHDSCCTRLSQENPREWMRLVDMLNQKRREEVKASK
jgi:hypothetical protein